MSDRTRVPDPDKPARSEQTTDDRGNPLEKDGQPLTGYDKDGNPVYGDQDVPTDETGSSSEGA